MWGGGKRGGDLGRWGVGLKACAAGSGRVLVSPPLFLLRRQPARHTLLRSGCFLPRLGAGGVISGTFLAARGVDVDASTSGGHLPECPSGDAQLLVMFAWGQGQPGQVINGK